MVDNQSNTYTPLEGRRPIDSPEADTLPPRDTNMCVYMGLVMAGIGFVLPYNRFVLCCADKQRESTYIHTHIPFG